MMSARDFMNGCRGTDQMDSGFASSGKNKKNQEHGTKMLSIRRQVHASYLPRSGLTQSPSAPGLGLRPVGRARSPEAWAPLGAANPRPRPAGGAPAPRGRGVPGRPALRTGPLALHVPPQRRREPRVSRGAARGAPGPGSAVHGHCPALLPLRLLQPDSSAAGRRLQARARPPLRLRGCRAPRGGRAAPEAGSLAASPVFQRLAALPAPTSRPGPRSRPLSLEKHACPLPAARGHLSQSSALSFDRRRLPLHCPSAPPVRTDLTFAPPSPGSAQTCVCHP